MKRREFLRMAALGLPAVWAGQALGQFGLDQIDIGKVVDGGTKMAKGASGIGLREELGIGGSVAVDIVASCGGLVKDGPNVDRVLLIGKSLARYCHRPELDYRFGILDTDLVNGFSAPAGYVFITRGLVEAVKDDDELAGVLAHEITHVTRRHALQILSRGKFIEGLTEVASGASSDFAAFDQGVGSVTNTLIKKGFDPDIEFETDRFGSQLAYDTGFRKAGLRDFLVSLKAAQGGSGKIFSTHPPLGERIGELNDHLG